MLTPDQQRMMQRVIGELGRKRLTRAELAQRLRLTEDEVLPLLLQLHFEGHIRVDACWWLGPSSHVSEVPRA